MQKNKHLSCTELFKGQKCGKFCVAWKIDYFSWSDHIFQHLGALCVTCSVIAPSACPPPVFGRRISTLYSLFLFCSYNFTGINFDHTLQDVSIIPARQPWAPANFATPSTFHQNLLLRSLLIFYISAPPAGPHQLLSSWMIRCDHRILGPLQMPLNNLSYLTASY